MPVDITRPTAHDALSLEELALYHLLMQYRATFGLDAIPLSKGLTATAGRHVVDTRENIWAAGLVLPAGANLHSWSDAPYYGDHRAPQVMWDAPERIGTGYTGNGFEISAAGYGSIAAALAGWQGSPGHNAVIAQTGAWSGQPFLAIGIGVETTSGAGPYGGRVFHVWFGHQADPTGVPDIMGSAVADSVRGTIFADRMLGMAGNDTLSGDAGADTLEGGFGADSLVGGAGDDTYRVNSSLDRVLELPGGGSDRVISLVSLNLAPEIEQLTLTGSLALNANGNGIANLITGTARDNRLNGGNGDDTLLGAAGSDTLLGGFGHDSLVGGAGPDFLAGGHGRDTLVGGPEPFGAEADTFMFGGPGEGPDHILDFGIGDGIAVSRAGFGGGLEPGATPDDRFAVDAPEGMLAQFVYLRATGTLLWDRDGTGAAPGVPIAVLQGAPDLGFVYVLD
jgi:Ca2+-binding RTX toxin-like protein